MATITEIDIREAAARLGYSERGFQAMQHLLSWLDAGGIGLDGTNQADILTILHAAWGPFAGTARDCMREVLDGQHDG